MTIRRLVQLAGVVALAAIATGLAMVSNSAAETPAPRIINGAPVATSIHDLRWRYLVSIGSRFGNPRESHGCGGTLISTRLVVTAAHCVVEEQEDGTSLRLIPTDLRVLTGVASLSEDGGQRVKVKDSFVHPGYETDRAPNDIAVLRLASSVAIDESVEPISLVAESEDSWWGAGQGIASPSWERGPLIGGWGDMTAWSKKPRYPARMREALMPIVPDSACAQVARPGLGDYGFSSESMFCGGVPDSDSNPHNGSTGTDTCVGDSGGPVTVGDGTGQWRLAGVVSWGIVCGARRYGAYTRIASYREWVASIPDTGGGPGGIGPIRNPQLTSSRRTSFTFSWDTPADTTALARYAIWVDVDDALELATTTRRRSLTVGDLDPGTRAVVYIAARSADGSESPLRKLVVRTSR
jgi:secreted trypsin-like serine protease